MRNLNAVVIGATGLVGKHLLEELAADEDYSSIKALVRKPINGLGPKVQTHVIDFENVQDLQDHILGDVLFICLGTTIKKAGSKEVFYKVDHDYVVNSSKAAVNNGVRSVAVVSATGSNASSFVFYNKVKGQMENDLKELGIEHLTIVKPSLILGDRDEMRLGESVGIILNTWLKPVLPARFRGSHAQLIARALRKAAKDGHGIQVIENEELMQYA